MSRVPDISAYTVHQIVHDVDLEGVVIPGLTGEYFRREESGRTATVGRYSYAGVQLFMAWGYRDEAHCSWTSYRSDSGDWTVPHRGCPRIAFTDTTASITTGSAVITLPLATPIASTAPPIPTSRILIPAVPAAARSTS